MSTIMKSNLISLTILISIVVRGEAENPTTEPNINTTTETNINTNTEPNINTTTEPNILNETKHKIDATQVKNDAICPEGQSKFTEGDLNYIISKLSEDLHIMENISDAYRDKAIFAANNLTERWNNFIRKFDGRPAHLMHVLQDINNTRQLQIVPQVNEAVATLQEFSVVQRDFDMLQNKTLKLLNDLERYKKICLYNNCGMQLQLRSSFILNANANAIATSISDDGSLCSTVAEVSAKVINKLSSFERDEIANINQIIDVIVKNFKESISEIKLTLRKTAVSQFGITMFEILNLLDDQFHFMETLKEFNKESLTDLVKKVNVNIQYKLLDLEPKIQQYRQHCLDCKQVRRRRRLAVEDVVKNTFKEMYTIDSESVGNKTNILDELLDDKIDDFIKVILIDVQHIFLELNQTIYNKNLVEEEIAKLMPVQESVSIQTQVEKQELETLIKSVPLESRKEIQAVIDKSQELLITLNETSTFLREAMNK